MKVFVSWSKSASKGVAEAFADWLPRVIQECDPFISSDTEKGDAWFDTIEKNLAEARVGVLFLTPQNKNAPWLNYEAGALRTLRNGNMKRLCAVFVGMKTADYDGPVKNFQMTNFVDKEDMFKLLKAINGAAEKPLDDRRLEDEFNEKWDRLVTDTAAAVEEAEASVEQTERAPRRTRSSDDKLDEVLDLLRELRFSAPPRSVTRSEMRESEGNRFTRTASDGELIGLYLLDDAGTALGTVIEAQRDGKFMEVLLDTGEHHRRRLSDFTFSGVPF
jgi:hypothetical protein